MEIKKLSQETLTAARANRDTRLKRALAALEKLREAQSAVWQHVENPNPDMWIFEGDFELDCQRFEAVDEAKNLLFNAFTSKGLREFIRV